MKNLYTAHVAATSGRDGSATSSDGRLSVKLGFPKELGGAGDATNPEQLFVAGYAACFASTLKGVASARSVKLGAVRVDGEGSLGVSDEGAYFITHVKLTVHADGLGDAGPSLVEDARRVCAYSNATCGNVVTDVVLA